MTPQCVEVIALEKLRSIAFPGSKIYRHIDEKGKAILMFNAPDFPTARALWKQRGILEEAIFRLGLAQYWQIKVEDCVYTPLERIARNESVLEKFKNSLPQSSAIRAAFQFTKLSLIRKQLIIYSEHASIAFVLMSQECLNQLADYAEAQGIRSISIYAAMDPSEEWIVMKNASLKELREGYHP